MENNNDFIIRIGGDAGDGIITMGEMFAKVAAKLSFNVITFRTFPAEIRGGECMMQIRISNKKIYHHGDKPNILLALNEVAYKSNINDLDKDGFIIYEQGIANVQIKKRYELPGSFLALETAGNRLAKNIVFLGALLKLINFPLSPIENFLADKFKKKGAEIIKGNLRALHGGYDYFQSKEKVAALTPKQTEKKYFMSGNEAIVLGALAAKVKLFFGYPITPSTDIMETLAYYLPRFGGKLLQTEDEISAISGVIGASYAGERALTATSGPGFSLMTEVLGLAEMMEVPLVVVDSQRGGPSTGLPTKTEQSDLNTALYGGHGDISRVVLAAYSVEDCFIQIIRAFNIAEKFQVPVILLLEQNLSTKQDSVSEKVLQKIKLEKRKLARAPDLKNYLRYKETEDGVSPMSLPGTSGGEYTATGLQHLENNKPAYDAETHMKMSAKRFRKLKAVAKKYSKVKKWPKRKLGIIVWGSTFGSAKEALDNLKTKGIDVNLYVLTMMRPLPLDLQNFIDACERVLAPELNFTGQLFHYLKSQLKGGEKLISYARLKTRPFEAREMEELVAGSL